MELKLAAGSKKFSMEPFNGEWFTLVIDLPDDRISDVCIYFEALDNMAMVRTPLRGEGRIHLYAWEGFRTQVDAALQELSTDFPIKVVEEAPGMLHIDVPWN